MSTQEHTLENVHIPNKKHSKKITQQALATNMWRKKVKTQQNDEVRYIFTPTKYSYNNNLRNILLWTNSREEERICVNKASLVGLFEVEWKIPRHNILVEFFNN